MVRNGNVHLCSGRKEYEGGDEAKTVREEGERERRHKGIKNKK